MSPGDDRPLVSVLMESVVIVSAVRTPIGKAGKGALRETRPDDLAAIVLEAALRRAGIAPHTVDDIILGCASPEAEQGLNVARIAALRAGLPEEIPGLTINRFCASGLEAIALAAAKIATGQAETVIAGGTESMSLVPFMGPSLRPNPVLAQKRPDIYLGMGPSVEQLVKEFAITREEADRFALSSHQKAIAAQDKGLFDAEIEPVPITDKAGETLLFQKDEGPRRDTSLEALAALKPAFTPDGILTAGNSSQRSDGAAALVLTSEARANKLHLKPLGRFVGYTTVAVSPVQFGIAPAYAIPKLLQRHGISLEQIDLIEFNEAFAAQVLAANKLYPLPMERVNVNGGAVALGHPLGATGARQTVTLLYEGARRKARYGLVTMCAALGMGAAGLFEVYA
ncbi:MAG TPA: thiolase family protein [Chthonomonas sp.]|nr:thiolase family protein [Chthonomonas sp.]HLI49413.1 thiolase family protein [Chthonomonas sp.]